MAGYIKLHRQITKWEWYSDIVVSRLFLHLLLIACYADTQYKGMVIPRGCVFTSRAALAKATGLSVKQVRRALEALENTGEIEKKTGPEKGQPEGQKRANNGTLIKVLNYAVYQDSDSAAGPEKGQPEGQKRARKGPDNRIRNKEEKNITPLTPQGETAGESLTVKTAGGAGQPVDHSTTPLDTRFAEFWSAYPKKIGKAAALKIYKRLKPSAQLHAQMLGAIDRQKRSEQWRRDNGQYIPHPTTWLNQGRWDDEPDIKTEEGRRYFDQ